MTFSLRLCLVVAQFVSPLLFFTNLTRNPYIAQICLLNISLAAAGALYLLRGPLSREPLRIPRTPLDAPWLATLGVCALSWLVAYFGHAAFFRPAIVSEGARNGLFLAVNAFLPFYLSAAVPWDDGEPGPAAPSGRGERLPSKDGEPLLAAVPLGWWGACTLAWGLLWLAFPQMRATAASSTEIWHQVWDAYGGLVWALGLGGALWLCRRGRVTDFLHLALAVGFLASVYGVCQYFNCEFMWPSVLNPYGGRSVSSFGNPNFLSSYNVVLLPVAVAYFIESRTLGRRLIYGALALALEAALLCSMTRSSWAGALAAMLLLVLSPELRRGVAQEPRPFGLLAGAGLALVLLWPQSSIASGYTPSVISRIAELGQAAKTQLPYSPWHQRVLIWGCAWLMGAENPLTGKGEGLFELFYPFYQGHLLNVFEAFRSLRTHANNAHNEILETWAQTGLLGLGVSVWMWTVFAATVRRWAAVRGRLPGIAMAAAAGVAGMLVDNLLNVSLHFAVPGFIFWWMAGLVMGLAAQERGGGHGATAPAGAGRFPLAERGGWRTLAQPAAAKALAITAAVLALAVSWYWVRVWNREVHYFTGFKLLRQGSVPLAVKQLEASRAWGPREVNAIYELGNAYARMERFADADQSYTEALQANAGYDEIYFNIAAINSSRLKHLERALDYYRMAWWINPLSQEVYNSLSAIFLQDPARYGPEAREVLERATHFFPDNPHHWHNLGYLDALEKRWPQAIAAYSRALALAPDMTVSERGLAAAAAQSGRPRPPILEGLARLHELDSRLSRGDYSPANLDLALRLAAQFPEMAKARFLAGSLLLVHGRTVEALPHLEWVVAREPGHVSALTNLARAYLSVGRSRDAAARFRETLKLDPRNAAAREGLRSLGLK